ncbi:unnamed protein product [Ambrosiozyma monospora]|uniref:Unnamed protein product n=1 Tax=Ambrosiozyma monospora TaxID=43982 RepID=A0A9W6T1N3_AMBMO|nr:unnamed protein product [Ambrosiozyma monospora]
MSRTTFLDVLYKFHTDSDTMPPSKLIPLLKLFSFVDNQLKLLIDNQLYTVTKPHQIKDLFQRLHAEYHGSPVLLLDLLKNKVKWFHPRAQLFPIDAVKSCSKCDLFLRFSELPAPLDDIKIPDPFDL